MSSLSESGVESRETWSITLCSLRPYSVPVLGDQIRVLYPMCIVAWRLQVKVKWVFPALSSARSFRVCTSVPHLGGGSSDSFWLVCRAARENMQNVLTTSKYLQLTAVLLFPPFSQARWRYSCSATSLHLLRVMSAARTGTLQGPFAQDPPVLGTFSNLPAVSKGNGSFPEQMDT